MKDWRFTLSVGCFILGILIVLQFKAQEKEGFPLATYHPLELIHMLKDSERKTVALNEQVQELKSRLSEYENLKTQRGNVSPVLVRELQRTRLEAGLVPVNGPGVEILLDDSKKRPRPGEDDYFYIVHDVDLNQLVNELWALGAEAVSVNGQRLVASSSIRCVGPTVLVNTVRVSPPYRVRAVGEPDTLAAGLKMRGGFLDALALSRARGVAVEIRKVKDLEIPAYSGMVTFRFAKPAGPK